VVFILLIVVVAIAVQLALNGLSREFTVHHSGVVLITGCSTGIGRDAVFAVAKKNYTVFATVRSNKDIKSLSDEAKEHGIEKYVIPIIMDVTNSAEIGKTWELIDAYMKEHNIPFVGVVNNAGISTRYPVEILPLDVARKVMDVNFFGAVEVTQKFLPMIRQYKGRILFISSISGVASLPGRGIYSASKRAIEGLVDALRLEMYSFDVSVTSILPGYVKSAIGDKLPTYENVKPEDYELYKQYLENVKKENEGNRADPPGPEVTSEAIVHALTDPYPHTRYYMGATGDFPPAVTVFLSKLLPDPLIDYVKMNRYK